MPCSRESLNMTMGAESKNYIAGAAINARRIVKFGAADHTVILAAAATDLSIGVSELGCTAAADRLDIIKEGHALVEFGGTVTRGQKLTSDATGRAVAAAPVAGVNNQIIGFAEVSAVVGDIGQMFIAPSVMQG